MFDHMPTGHEVVRVGWQVGFPHLTLFDLECRLTEELPLPTVRFRSPSNPSGAPGPKTSHLRIQRRATVQAARPTERSPLSAAARWLSRLLLISPGFIVLILVRSLDIGP